MTDYTLEPLPYAYDALEPFIDAQTMKVHHDKHHQAYLDKLLVSLEKHPKLKEQTSWHLVANLKSVPDDIKTAVRNQGGGFVNHNFFWHILKKGTSPHGEIQQAITASFGSFDIFKKEFTTAATTLFGSGWAWLVVDHGQLKIVTTQNQDNPISEGKHPVLGVDVWEHAYYLKYQNRRPEYLEAFFNVINWDKVNEHYMFAKKR